MEVYESRHVFYICTRNVCQSQLNFIHEKIHGKNEKLADLKASEASIWPLNLKKKKEKSTEEKMNTQSVFICQIAYAS